MSVLLAALIASSPPSFLFQRTAERDHLRAQVLTGIGGGPNHEGLFVTAAIGGTLPNGLALSSLNVFLQNQGVLGPNRGADGFFGSLFALGIPLHFAELELKLGAGFGAVIDEHRPGLIPGVMLAHGLDVHLPVFAAHGPTLAITFLHTLVPAHYFSVCAGAGYTFF